MTSQSCKLYGETICKDVFSLSIISSKSISNVQSLRYSRSLHTAYKRIQTNFCEEIAPSVEQKKKKYATYLSCLPMTIYQCKYSLNMFILAFKIFVNSPIFLYKEVIIKSSTMLIFPRKYYLHKNCVKSIRGKKGFVCCDNTEMRLSE